MSRASLIRSVRFSAGHHYWKPDWSAEKNRAHFGPSVHRHGHNFRVEVVVEGPVDPDTGFVVDLAQLDALLKGEVVEPLDQRDLTEAVPDFRPGAALPTTENLARWIWDRLEGRVPGTAVLERVRVFESEDLGAEYRGPGEVRK